MWAVHVNTSWTVDPANNAVKIDTKKKRVIRQLVRDAIRAQNREVLFSCENCIFFDQCDFDKNLSINRVQAHQLPECFSFDGLKSPYGAVLETFHEMGIDFIKEDHGWPTIISRIIARTNKFGMLINVKQSNLYA